MKDGEKGMALLIALMGSCIRDAHTVGRVSTLGDVKPVRMRDRIKAANEAVEIVCEGRNENVSKEGEKVK